MKSRLIIVSNRLPFSIKKKSGKFEVTQSSGGLVSAIRSIPKENRILWIGAADFKKETWEEYQQQKSELEFDVAPVYIDKKMEGPYYNGFSNSLIWPLFHYVPSYAEYDEVYYTAYKAVNNQFAEAVKNVAESNDIIWVHDYHLMLLPGLLKQGSKKLSNSFFLHIPFPTYELVKLVPQEWRNEILVSLLACDVIGFQINEYSNHFKQALSYFLGAEAVNNSVTVNGHTALIKDYPISIEYEKFNDAFDDAEVTAGREEIRKKYEGVKIMFSIDRLDYSKGVMNRLQAYEQLLKNYEELRGQIVFVLNVIPSREKISKYAERKKLIEENVSRINGLFGNIQWQPIIYQYQHLSFPQLLASYTACDIALVTPLRDGMNLVAKEFIASRKDERGCLILSEFAGAVKELTGAILVNPNDVHMMKEAMLKAIHLKEDQQQERMRVMQEAIRNNDVNKWSSSFLGDVNRAGKREEASKPNIMTSEDKTAIFEAYSEAEKRLILLDYDGTLIPFFEKPQEAVPGEVLKELVSKLASSPRNKVMLISGRDGDTLQTWFNNGKIDIVAEHGSAYKEAGSEEWKYPSDVSTDWKEEVKNVIANYISQVPGSFLEEKKYSIAWHYRGIENMDEEGIRMGLSKDLSQLSGFPNFDILHGNKVIEIKSNKTNKGKFVKKYISEKDFDFVLAIGDDMTDEDMFNELKGKNHYTIKVGLGKTGARFNLTGVNNVLSFLEQMGTYKDLVVR